MDDEIKEQYASCWRDRLALLLHAERDKPIPLAFQGFLLGQDGFHTPLLYQIFTQNFGILLDELFLPEVPKKEPIKQICSLVTLQSNLEWAWTHLPIYQRDAERYKHQLQTTDIFVLREFSKLFGYSIHELCTEPTIKRSLKVPSEKPSVPTAQKKGMLQLQKLHPTPKHIVEFVSVKEVPSSAQSVSIRSQSQLFGLENEFVKETMQQIPKSYLKLPKTCHLFHCNEGKLCFLKHQVTLYDTIPQDATKESNTKSTRQVWFYLVGGANSLCGAFDAILTNARLLYRFCIWLTVHQHSKERELYLQLFGPPPKGVLPSFCQLQVVKNQMQLYRILINNK